MLHVLDFASPQEVSSGAHFLDCHHHWVLTRAVVAGNIVHLKISV